MNLTILIISYKSIHKLEKCLSTIGSEREIIILENSNNALIKEVIEKKYKNCKIILNNKNLGYGAAANIGFRNIRSQYAILLNTDIVINENQLSNIEKEISSCKDDFALASPIYDDLIDFNKNKDFDKNLNTSELNINSNESITKVDLIKGCALVVNLKKFENKNVFDNKFFFFFEEIDLCKRMKMMKENIFVFNKIKIIHEAGGSVDNESNFNYSDFRHWNYYWSRFYYHKKHYGYLFSFIVHFSKLIRFFLSTIFLFPFSKSKFKKNKSRLTGLFSSMIGIKSSISDKIINKLD